MAYQKQEWKNLPDKSSPFTEERMDHMEEGIANAVDLDSGQTINGTKTFEEPIVVNGEPTEENHVVRLKDIEEKWVDVPFTKLGTYEEASVKSNGKVVDIDVTRFVGNYGTANTDILRITDEKYFPKTFAANIVFVSQQIGVIHTADRNNGGIHFRNINITAGGPALNMHLSYNLFD